MDGLQLIQDRILEQARETAAEITAKAQEQSQAVIEQAQSERDRYLAESSDKTKAQTEAMLNRAASLASMEKRKNNLQRRQRLIDRVIDQALSKVCNIPAAEKLELYSSLINTYNTIPIFTPIFNAVPIKNPTNDEKPSFILWVKSFFANIYSDIVAPKNAPMKTPKMLPTIPPIIEPSTAPIVPYLEPPEYFVLSVPANSSANVERMDIMKSMMRISGVII